jgi:hypothetical protein
MNGPDKQNDNGSTKKQNDDAAPVSSRQPSPLALVRGQQAQEQHRQQLKEQRRALQKSKTEFRQWKRDLCKIINTESEMVRNKDGSYSFVLPAKITRLVYEVMLREHMAMKDCSREEAENAVRQGFVGQVENIEQIRSANQEAIAAAEEKLGRPVQAGDVIDTPFGKGEIVDQPRVQPAPRDDDQSEEEAAAELAKMRAEMVGKLDAPD